jgi:hypothetical protein
MTTSAACSDYDHDGLHARPSSAEARRSPRSGARRLLGGRDRRGKGSDDSPSSSTPPARPAAQGRDAHPGQRHGPQPSANAFDKLTENDEIIAYLPLAWVGDHLLLRAGLCWPGFASTARKAPRRWSRTARDRHHLRLRAAARLREPADLTMVRMEDAGRAKRGHVRLLHGAGAQGRRGILDGKRSACRTGCSTASAISSSMAAEEPLRAHEHRVGYTAGEAIGPEIFRFYRSLGVNLKQLYGQTEASVYITNQPDGEIDADTVGKPLARRRGQDRRQRRGALPLARRVPGSITRTPKDRRDQDAGRLGAFRRCRVLRRARPPQDHRPRQGRRASCATARCSRRNTSRTSSSSSPTSRRRWPSATAATTSPASSTSI